MNEMQTYKVTSRLFYTTMLSFSILLNAKAQLALPEGILTYKADTIKRLKALPAAYIVSQMIVYKKLDQLRIEIWRVNRFNKTDVEKDIHITAKKGSYIFIESSDSFMTELDSVAIFMSYDDEKLYQAERALQGYAVDYKVDKVLKSIRWLNLPAQKVLLKGGINNDNSTMVFTKSLDIPISLCFDLPIDRSLGTPLQFTIYESGWMTRLTATDLKSAKISDTLFQIDPKRKIMSLERMMQGISDSK